MTKDEFRAAAEEQNNKMPPGKDTAGGGKSSAQARPPQAIGPRPPAPKAPFGMPNIPPVATNIKIINPPVAPVKDEPPKEN